MSHPGQWGLLVSKLSPIYYKDAHNAVGLTGVRWCLISHRSYLGYRFSPSHNLAFNHPPSSYFVSSSCIATLARFLLPLILDMVSTKDPVSLRDEDGKKGDNSQKFLEAVLY